ncbi:MAG: hypothetical protein OEW88_01990 [Gammaproteobacteria bacterium]|nr:hypothetical protein [Gammaproteobacteria bacterium]
MNLLERIMALTTAIEARVADADWAGATDLDLERRELLRDLFAMQPDVVRDGASRAILEQLRARTDATSAAVHETRRALSAAARQLQTAPGVVRAYERNTDSAPRRVAATAGE